MKISLWATNLAAPKRDLSEWLATVERMLLEAKAAGSSVLVMPEYACAHWLSSHAAPPERGELAWLAETARAMRPRLSSLVERHGVSLLAGTFPTANDAGEYTNRALLLSPQGEFEQDKLARSSSPVRSPSWARSER